jgi:hypothetical protein
MDGMKSRGRGSWIGMLFVLVAMSGFGPTAANAAQPPQVRPVRAAHLLHYMPAEHLDVLAANGFTRAVILFHSDSLREQDGAQLRAIDERARSYGMEVVPQFQLDAPTRLASRPADRRYTWGRDQVEPVACPMDSMWWAEALLQRAGEILHSAPGTLRLAIDLELRHGSRRFYDAGPCRCVHCLREFRPNARPEQLANASQSGLRVFQENRLRRVLESILAEFIERHPGVELGIYDLDLNVPVHRALGRALAADRIPVADYCTRSYESGGGGLKGVRARLNSLGLDPVSVIGGIWLKRLKPDDLEPAVASVLDRADGYVVYSTYSLWREPHQLLGPYTLNGEQGEYWGALREANGPAGFGKPPVAAHHPPR